jgi:signal transduction histidine kinase
MIRIAAHDLKNPLSVVTGYVSLMLDDDGTSQVSRYRLMIEAMRRASHRMVQIIDDILSLERIERMSNNPQHLFDLRATVEQAAAEYIERAAQKRQEFLMEMVEGELMVRGDPAQIREAATNFMSNAIKYTPDGGHIIVRLVHDASSVRFEVQDTGFGIPEAMQERLFQPFYRARTDETLAIEGTGLGLHLVKNIIDRHSGSIIFQSVYGEGSTFGFRLPEAVAALNMDVTQEIPRAPDSKAAEAG